MDDRRTSPRVASDRTVTLLGDHKVVGTTSDIGLRGVLCAFDPMPDLATGDRVTLEIDGIGRIDARVVSLSTLGCHVTFTDMDADTRKRLEAIVTEAD